MHSADLAAAGSSSVDGGGFPGRGELVKALREYSPQARHHFTRFDQVEQLVRASEATADTGFMARLMMLCSLPRTNPGAPDFSTNASMDPTP